MVQNQLKNYNQQVLDALIQKVKLDSLTVLLYQKTLKSQISPLTANLEKFLPGIEPKNKPHPKLIYEWQVNH